MSARPIIGEIIKKQRKSIPLTLDQLSKMSGVSAAHLGRIEQGERRPSAKTLQKIAKPLGFDLNELLVMSGILSPEPSILSEEQRETLLSELNMLLQRITSDSDRIIEIINRLLLTK